MWAREVGGWASASVPLHAAEHFYIVTQPIPGLAADAPILRDADACSYFKEDTGKLLVGWFEPRAKPWGEAGIPENFAFDQLPADLGHIRPLFAAAMARAGARSAGVQASSTARELSPMTAHSSRGAGGGGLRGGRLHSIGIQSAGAAKCSPTDRRRASALGPWDVISALCAVQQPALPRDRTVETLGLLYDMHGVPASRDRTRRVQVRPARRLAAAGACSVSGRL
jgi:4-methylaminobutanoate oxidase (formaldehyde-forming)